MLFILTTQQFAGLSAAAQAEVCTVLGIRSPSQSDVAEWLYQESQSLASVLRDASAADDLLETLLTENRQAAATEIPPPPPRTPPFQPRAAPLEPPPAPLRKKSGEKPLAAAAACAWPADLIEEAAAAAAAPALTPSPNLSQYERQDPTFLERYIAALTQEEKAAIEERAAQDTALTEFVWNLRTCPPENYRLLADALNEMRVRGLDWRTEYETCAQHLDDLERAARIQGDDALLGL